MPKPEIKHTHKTMRIRRACEVYEVSRSTIYRAIDAGIITPTKMGSCVFLSVKQLDKLFLGGAE